MFRSLTVLLAVLLFGLSVADSDNDKVVLGLFQKVHIEPNSTGGSPAIFIRGTSILRNSAEIESKASAPENPHRIVGGRVVSITEVPWQAALIQDRRFVCGASVISTIWVLTAAHCIYGFGNSTFVVRAGSDNFRTGGQIRRVGFMTVHGLFISNQFANDVGMVRVTRRFTFGSTVQPVRLARPYTRIPNVLFVSGWGTTSETSINPARRLRGVNVNFISRSTCVRLYAGSNYTILNSMICAGNLQTGGRDSCQGDSGGPLVSGGIQFGIVSYGFGCARAQYPGIYTDVGVMNTWILTVARTFSRRSYPDEKEEYDIRKVVVDMDDTTVDNDDTL